MKPTAESNGLHDIDVLRVAAQQRAHLADRVIAAISAPTSLAIEAAEAADITPIAFARDEAMNVHTHPRRIHEGAGG